MLTGYKTYLTGGLTILGALLSHFTQGTPWTEVFNLAVPAVLAMTVRSGIATTAAGK